MSEEERQDALKVMRAFNENRDSSSYSRGRGGRGRGNRTAQRPKADKSEAEADIAEITSGGVSCFNAEITGKISDLSTLDDDDTEDSPDRPVPTILFTFSDDSEPKTDKQPNPKVESSPLDSAEPLNSGSVFSSFWTAITFVLVFLGGLLVGACTETYKSILYCLKKCFQFLQSAGFMLLSFISNPMQSAQSATACSTAQYKPYFRFFGGSYIQYGITTAILIIMMIVAILLQCGAQAASLGYQMHINATKSLLSAARISPFLSEQAAESLLQYKNGSWLLPCQREDLEAHVATTRSADRDISLDWCLDSGASCHFCNDSSKFVSMRKCNVSVSTAKKGESIQAIGIGNCKITTQTANGELVNLILHDVLYVPDARRNLLSVSKLSQDRFQVVLPADNSIFRPGIYNCRKSKSSVEQSIPIIPVGTLFHVQTCADAEIKRHDRVENKWICWHRRLGYMPLATIQHVPRT